MDSTPVEKQDSQEAGGGQPCPQIWGSRDGPQFRPQFWGYGHGSEEFDPHFQWGSQLGPHFWGSRHGLGTEQHEHALQLECWNQPCPQFWGSRFGSQHALQPPNRLEPTTPRSGSRLPFRGGGSGAFMRPGNVPMYPSMGQWYMADPMGAGFGSPGGWAYSQGIPSTPVMTQPGGSITGVPPPQARTHPCASSFGGTPSSSPQSSKKDDEVASGQTSEASSNKKSSLAVRLFVSDNTMTQDKTPVRLPGQQLALVNSASGSLMVQTDDTAILYQARDVQKQHKPTSANLQSSHLYRYFREAAVIQDVEEATPKLCLDPSQVASLAVSLHTSLPGKLDHTPSFRLKRYPLHESSEKFLAPPEGDSHTLLTMSKQGESMHKVHLALKSGLAALAALQQGLG